MGAMLHTKERIDRNIKLSNNYKCLPLFNLRNDTTPHTQLELPTNWVFLLYGTLSIFNKAKYERRM